MNNEYLYSVLNSMGIPCDKDLIDKLHVFYEMLLEKNKEMNLTSITSYEDVMKKHFADSLAVLKFHMIQKEDKVLDLGTGGGFPGIPLKIFLPETQFMLVDSVNKKLEFIRSVIERFKFTRIEVKHGRAEELAKEPSFREQYDLVLSRAVASLPVLSELALGFVKEGGLFISYKGSAGRDEAATAEKAVSTMGAETEAINDYELPGGDKRCLIFIRKTTHTPDNYPRKAGLPSKRPL